MNLYTRGIKALFRRTEQSMYFSAFFLLDFVRNNCQLILGKKKLTQKMIYVLSNNLKTQRCGINNGLMDDQKNCVSTKISMYLIQNEFTT